MKKPLKSLSPLGQTLRSFRIENRYTIDDLANLSGLAKGYVWELETMEDCNPSLSTLISLARAMKKPVGWLANRAVAIESARAKKGGV